MTLAVLILTIAVKATFAHHANAQNLEQLVVVQTVVIRDLFVAVMEQTRLAVKKDNIVRMDIVHHAKHQCAIQTRNAALESVLTILAVNAPTHAQME